MSDDESLPMTKVLVVDDSRMVRATITKHIRGRFDVRDEADGEAGWEALLVDPAIQVVLTDIGMPRLDGFGLLERIRGSRVQRVQDLPVIIISGDEDDEARDRALKLGANDFVAKGASSAELLARLDSLVRLARTRRELDESRAALATQSPLDPVSGLATASYLSHHAEQEMALARRHRADISVMVIDIDHYDQLGEWHGSHVAELITRKLSKILSTKVRREDTVSQLAPSRFAVLSPSTDLIGCCAFALRLQRAMEKLVMTYRDERIRISVTIGVSSSAVDGMQTVEHLIETAAKRVQRGVVAGGNRVVGDQGEVDQAMVDRHLKQAISIDHALLQLRVGAADEVAERLPDVIATLLPLLELIESRLQCGLPLEQLKQYDKGRVSGSDDMEGTQTSV
ncbi:MAG: diguanylate cyclase response regulator [Betaproteobacteria bacterium HGW-Betaproteobacteria-13]|jgi:diguanylate cyclase (GGDEF)-like protein|uniref:Diguanylate cyclase response regulator n=1 Tax=Parazoarcus communis TaxID=41977 RepID=A0A2U8GYJ4_9RHOO|nr:diguanylate cyclase [Parazoarcus communis]AWI78046.1 diguanylate cyclase response regulator [Parazoarcus communis]PKO80312.1 MAG: diguanylate cyclase response regulator [Betaproteobacteria bacterium HGW-Betaproteobacteria-13]